MARTPETTHVKQKVRLKVTKENLLAEGICCNLT